jgi:hypothetical protein
LLPATNVGQQLLLLLQPTLGVLKLLCESCLWYDMLTPSMPVTTYLAAHADRQADHPQAGRADRPEKMKTCPEQLQSYNLVCHQAACALLCSH